jgi:hypothetical protein
MRRISDNRSITEFIYPTIGQNPKITFMILVKQTYRITRQAVCGSIMICNPVVKTVNAVVFGADP